jgi:hypothetical protein
MSAESAGTSSRSLGGSPEGEWRSSSRCAQHGSCVEVARLAAGLVGVRDGKLGESSPVLAFGAGQWRAYLAGITAGQFRAG